MRALRGSPGATHGSELVVIVISGLLRVLRVRARALGLACAARAEVWVRAVLVKARPVGGLLAGCGLARVARPHNIRARRARDARPRRGDVADVAALLLRALVALDRGERQAEISPEPWAAGHVNTQINSLVRVMIACKWQTTNLRLNTIPDMTTDVMCMCHPGLAARQPIAPGGGEVMGPVPGPRGGTTP